MSSEKQLLKLLVDGMSLTSDQISHLFALFFAEDSSCTDAQMGAFLFALGQRSPSAQELLGGAQALRSHMSLLPLSETIRSGTLLDTCGTGGSGHNSFNTSTVLAFILAAAGILVVKHGNRSSTSACGSADLLEALGISLTLPPEEAATALEKSNFCFCFAPLYHRATRRVQAIRKELGFRTIFNFLGPLANPAQVPLQILGVSSEQLLLPMAEALQALGIQRAFVVRGEDGLDEITLTGNTRLLEVTPKKIEERIVVPNDFGLPSYQLSQILGGTVAENLRITNGILSGERSPHRDLVLANASAALLLCDKVTSLPEGVALASSLLDSGTVAASVQKIQQAAPLTA